MDHPHLSAYRRAVLGTGLLLACASAGCGAGHGEVTGMVACGGKPVVVGTVLVVGSDGLPRYGNLGEDGSYVIPCVPTGVAKVAVNSPDPAEEARLREKAARPAKRLAAEVKGNVSIPRPEPPLPMDRKLWFRIPAQYGNPQTSGLTCDVKPGTNICNLDLR